MAIELASPSVPIALPADAATASAPSPTVAVSVTPVLAIVQGVSVEPPPPEVSEA
jgi:hypothetical protein